nr:PREDICTED: uncharacterized protein LOC109040666 [Bemisia tabaci]
MEDHTDVFKILLNHIFTDYELLLRTHILQSLRKSYLTTLLRDQGENAYFYEHYDEERFQDYTDTLFQFLMTMGQAFPDNKNLSIFVNQEIKSSFFGTNMEFDIGSGHHNSPRWETDSDHDRCAIEWAKSQTLGTSSVTVYDILTQNVQQLTLYMRNESIAEDLKLPKIASNFDFIKDILLCQIRKGTFRRKLLNRSSKLCHLLLVNLEILPHDITEMILNFLTNQELEIVIHACYCIVKTKKN